MAIYSPQRVLPSLVVAPEDGGLEKDASAPGKLAAGAIDESDDFAEDTDLEDNGLK